MLNLTSNEGEFASADGAAGGSMEAGILHDGHNLTLANSTGIGTYARTLAATAAKVGFKPEILLGGNASIDRRDRQLVAHVIAFDGVV
jgi:hypothetical protein